MSLTHHYYDAGALVIHYVRAGAGDAVVLLHGWPQTHGRRWHHAFHQTPDLPEALQSLQRVALDVRGGVVADCGHWMPEEQPEVVAEALLEFFAADKGASSH